MISAGRVGVRPDQVDPYGRIKVTNELALAIKEKLDLIEAGRLMALEQNNMEVKEDKVEELESDLKATKVEEKEVEEKEVDETWQSVQEE